ncbi:MAG: 50S ribosomal protein L19e [Candidatus Aenigmatarchaeota archaeon]|nr:50S ribosomal protein L19e [Candidatus Aenigmarchaeota archaeon]
MSQYTTSNTQRKIAAKILKCGISKVWIDPKNLDKVNAAITRKDIKRLIEEGIIKKRKEKIKASKSKSKRQGLGSRKGKKHARLPSGKKTQWLKIVRPQRKLLSELKPELEKGVYREIYKKIKGNMFRSKAHLLSYLSEKGLIKKKQKA